MKDPRTNLWAPQPFAGLKSNPGRRLSSPSACYPGSRWFQNWRSFYTESPKMQSYCFTVRRKVHHIPWGVIPQSCLHSWFICKQWNSRWNECQVPQCMPFILRTAKKCLVLIGLHQSHDSWCIECTNMQLRNPCNWSNRARQKNVATLSETSRF